MILASAAHAEGEGAPPLELELYFQWRTWGVLPEAGGLRDQRAGELERMRQAGGVYEAVKRWKGRKSPGKMSEADLADYKIVSSVNRLKNGE